MSSPLRLIVALLLTVCLQITGCEGVFVGFVSNPVGSVSVSGKVTVVQLGFVKEVTGKLVIVTTVTFLNAGTATFISFCGDQSRSFPVNQFVSAEFSQGVLCAVLSSVIVTT